MNKDSAFASNPPSARENVQGVNPVSCSGSKKILVNPLVAGNNIHYNKGKYTIASSNFAVRDSTGSVGARSEKVHYNPKFLNYTLPKKENIHVNPNYLPATTGYSNSIHVNPNFLSKVESSTTAKTTYSSAKSTTSSYASNKYKYVRKDNGVSSQPVVSVTQNPEPTTVSKYKLIYSSAPSTKPTATVSGSSGIVIKSKYSIRTCQPNKKPTTPVSDSSRVVNRESKKRISCDFKRISRTKLVRKTVHLSRSRHNRRFVLKMNQKRTSYLKPRKQLFKINNKTLLSRSRGSSECGSFQAYSSRKIVRKSVLRAQIASRKLLRKSLNSSVTHKELQTFVKSKYKLVRKGAVVQKKDPVVSPSKRSNRGTKSKRKSVIAKLTSKLRKNNQRCLFYNRFGRCKGKDRGTCNKIHDPLYVSICKKLPFGECTDASCLLSHDMKPGKMPTCYHYLAGICKRDSCPFLHIKVNPKSPICSSFLQGYCPDVFNCLKRHEYVCPVFAEKGACAKGKSCAHPHKIPNVHTKLLCDDQRPLISKNPKPKEPLFVISDTGSDPSASTQLEPSKPSKDPPVFTRYFAVPLTSDLTDNDASDMTHTS